MLKGLNSFILLRNISTKAPSDGFEQAISWLIKTASTKKLTPEEHRVLVKERPWATAPVIISHGKTSEPGARANGLIRWLDMPERDICIEFGYQDNMYRVQVKALYYAILSAMLHHITHAVIYSTNEIVVKVGKGIFTPKKEARLFEAIRRRTATAEEGEGTRVRLHTLDHTALDELNLTLEKAISRENVPVCSEELFRERHSSEIIRI